MEGRRGKGYHAARIAAVLLGLSSGTGIAGIEFSDETAATGIDAEHDGTIYSCGQAVADVNGSGWQDLFVTGHAEPNRLFINQGDGTFVESPLGTGVLTPSGSDCGPSAFADYNNDGWPDLYVTCLGNNHLFRNDGGAGFTDVTEAAGVDQPGRSQVVAWGDLNADGWLDLFVGYYPESLPVDPEDESKWDRLFLNNGDGTFTSISHLLDPQQLIKTAFAANFTDIDNDGDLDLYVVNDRHDGNTLWRNDGPGCGGWCLTDVSAMTGADRPVDGMGIAVGDVDLDGDLDLYFSSYTEQVYLENRLSEDGQLVFEEATQKVGLAYSAIGWATHFMDMDNDRWLDAYLAVQGVIPKSDRVFASAKGSFVDVTDTSGASDQWATLGASQWDYDRDGRQDLVVCNANRSYRVLRNITPEAGDWLEIELVGGGPVNLDAVGTRVTLTTSDGDIQIREVTAGQGRAGNSMLPLHFGLGEETVTDLTVRWPDGLVTRPEPPAANQYLVVSHPGADRVFADGFEP